jgi:pilus assembly protein CpaE
VIVDLDLQFGDVATALHLTPDQDLADALLVKNLDAMALKTFLTPHPSGLYALCGPDSPARADAITGENVSQLINLLAEEFRFVIVDTAPGLTEHTLAVFDLATHAVLVAGMDVPSIRGLAKELDILRELSLTRMTQHIVLNFADRRSGMTVKDVEAVIGTTVDIVLPRSKTVPMSTNRGVPLLQSGGRDAVVTELNRLVARFQLQLKKTIGHAPRHRAWTR